MIVRILQPADHRDSFSCGDPDYDNFLRKYAGQNQFERRISTTMVVVDDETVLAYATFSVAEVSRDDLPAAAARGLPAYPLPAMRLGRLAVDERFQGIGLGTRLIGEVLGAALRLRASLGCVAVLVDALPDKQGFYAALGFEEASVRLGRPRIPGTVLMVLPLADVAKASEDG